MSYTQSEINHAGQIALNALSVGRNPTDTAGMDSDDEEWYLSKDGDGSIDELILHLYKLLKNQKKKGSQKNKRSKKKKKRSKKKRSRTRKRKGK